jgi:hypothetical protein
VAALQRSEALSAIKAEDKADIVAKAKAVNPKIARATRK